MAQYTVNKLSNKIQGHRLTLDVIQYKFEVEYDLVDL